MLLRPRAEWRIELAHLDPEARHAEVQRRIQAQVLEHLDAHPSLLPAVARERLRNVDAAQFEQALRRLRIQHISDRSRNSR